MSQYLGDISAYALAVSQGYTGTEEEYAELMASYATVGQTAVTAAQTATTKASEAATSATTATNKATEATTAATTATNKAAEAQADADAAALDASQAMSAASTATTKATEATTAAATATSAATTATTAKDDAVSAKTAAQTAQTGAETAAASVQSSAAQIATNAEDISQLKSDIEPLENEDLFFNSLNHIVNSTINFSNKYVTVSTQGGVYIPIKPNDHLVMKRGTTTGYYALLKNRTGYLTSGATANLCDSFSSIKSINARGVDTTVPSDATFLWIYAYDNSNNYLPSVIMINNYDCAKGLKSILDQAIYKSNTSYEVSEDNNAIIGDCFEQIVRNGVDLSDISSNGYWSRDDGVSLLSNSAYDAGNKYINVNAGKTYYGFYDGEPYSYWSVTWYDANKHFISGALSNNAFVAPVNSKFVRLSWSKADIDTDKLVFTEYTQAQVSAYVGDLSAFGYDYLLTDDVKNSVSAEHSRLYGKKLCVIGDSICYGVGYLGGYAGIIANEHSMNVQNLGISGATLCTGVTGHQSIYSTIASLDNDGDYYIFEGGFNDYNQHVPLFAEGGSFVERIPQSPNGITSNIYDCMENLCYHLNVTFKGKKVGFVFPHKISYTDWEKNNLNLAYKDYKDLQKKVLAKYAIPYIDLSEVSGMNTRYADVANAYTHNGDYVHPNQLGYETYYAPKISAWMNMM